jgi:hypothetical protein
LILFVSLLVCFPQTFINLLLFSFQRPGVASSVTVVTGEREYRKRDSLSTIFFTAFVAFSFLRLAGPFCNRRLANEGCLYRVKANESSAFYSFFFFMSLFYLQGLKSIIFNDLASPGGTKKRLSGGPDS